MTVNRERGELALTVGAQSYVLRLTVESCCALEATAGTKFEAIVKGLQPGNVKEWRALLWAALQDRHAAAFPTLEAVGDLMTAAGGTSTLMPTLRRFLDLNAPDPQTPLSGRRPRAGRAVEAPAPVPKGWGALFVQARKQGIPGDQFWKFSLRELWLELEAGRQRIVYDRHRDITNAWFAAALVWQKQLPQLDKLLSREDAGAQSLLEQRFVIEQFAAHLGKSLIREPRES